MSTDNQEYSQSNNDESSKSVNEAAPAELEELQISTESEIDDSSENNEGPEGVGGWLGFFIYANLILTPILTIASVVTTINLLNEYGDVLKNSFKWLITFELIVDIGYAVAIMVGAYKLKNIQSRCVQFIKNVLIAGIVINSVFVLLYAAGGFFETADIIAYGRVILFCVIWYHYFNESVRVKNTYPDWNEINRYSSMKV